MAEAESEEAIRHRDKASEMLKDTSSITLPAIKEPKSSYFLTKSLAEMVNEDPIRLRYQSCVIHEELVKIIDGGQLVYSSLARLPTFSIGLSSTQGEDPLRTALRESSVDPKEKSSHCYFQMPELGARVFVGDSDGFDTIACHLFDESYEASEFDLDSEYAAVRSLYKDDRPGGLSGWLRAQPVEFWRTKHYSEVILSGTELFVGPPVRGATTVGNLGGKSSRVFGSSSDYTDCTGDETIGKPSDIAEQSGDLVPSVHSYRGINWKSVEKPDLWRSTKGSYLEKPKFMNTDRCFLLDLPGGDVLQLTRFDDFVILGNTYFDNILHPRKVIDIVQKNASETVDVIAAQLVKGIIEESWPALLRQITAIVIFLDHKEILLREHEKVSTLKEEEKIFAIDMDDMVKILLPNVPQTSTGSLEEIYELGMKSTTISSNLTNAKVQDDSKASSSVVLIEHDNCKSEDFMFSCHITKWIIYGDMLERTLLCLFNTEEMQYEFYFEDHESMASIIGLGVPSSKVILECGSPRVTVVEILEEDWDEVWALSNVIPYSIPEGNVLKQERFLDILHCIANVINADNIASKANNGGAREGNGKGKAHGNVDDSKGKGKSHDHDDHRNASHPNGGSNGPPDDNDKKERKGKDGKDDKEDGRDGDDGKTSNDCKEVQAVIHLRLLPGGVLEDKGKQKELRELHEEEIEENKKRGKKNKKKRKRLWHVFKGGENGNVVGNQQEGTTTEGVEDGDVDENLQKQLENQIHSQMVFTFSIKNEAGGPLKTIQATIDPITFQFPSNNEENYLQRRRFGWFHEKLQVAFGVVDTQVANLDAKSCKILDSSEAKEVNLHGNSKGNTKTSTNAYKGAMGIQYGVKASGAYGRIDGLEAKTTEEVQNSWETNRTLTRGGFSISEHTDLNTHQLKYSYHPHYPFVEKEFEVKDEGDRLNMYDLNPICQLQRVSCEGTWHPDHSENLEAYKLEASRELGMTRIYDLELEIGVEKKRKGVWKVEKNLPLCFIQKLEKVVYLNHAMSHLTSSTIGVYRLKERQDPSNPSTSILTQGQRKEELEWPSNDPLVDVKQLRNI